MEIVKVTDANFEEEVLKSDKKVLVDFWATWCGPCQMLAPIIEQVAKDRDDIKVCKIDVDTEPMLSFKYEVKSIPTLVVFENGVEVDKTIGLVSREEIDALLK